MRHNSPDIKDGPSIGVNIQKRLELEERGYKNTPRPHQQATLSVTGGTSCHNTPTLGKIMVCRGTIWYISTFIQGDTTEVSQK